MKVFLAIFLSFSFSSFENVFIRGDIKNLEKYLLNERKVYVELSVPFSVYGFFSKSQILSIFKKIFEEYETEEFKIKAKIEKEDSLILNITWKIKEKIKMEKKKANIFIRFNFEKSGWKIAEIKGTP